MLYTLAPQCNNVHCVSARDFCCSQPARVGLSARVLHGTDFLLTQVVPNRLPQGVVTNHINGEVRDAQREECVLLHGLHAGAEHYAGHRRGGSKLERTANTHHGERVMSTIPYVFGNAPEICRDIPGICDS